MLAITRQRDERVLIGDPKNPLCIIKIINIKGDRVIIGFEAAQSIPVHREEIANRIIQQGDN